MGAVVIVMGNSNGNYRNSICNNEMPAGSSRCNYGRSGLKYRTLTIVTAGTVAVAMGTTAITMGTAVVAIGTAAVTMETAVVTMGSVAIAIEQRL